MANSFILEKLNSCFNFFQNRFAYFVENSVILQNIDNFIFVLILGTLFLTTFAQSSLIGMVASCVIVLTFFKLLIKKGEKIELQSFDFALIIYLLFCIISTINSTLFHQSLYGLNKTLIYVGFYFSTFQYLKSNKEKIPFFIYCIALIISAESVIGILQQKAGVLAGATWQDVTNLNPEEVMTRVFGTIKPLNPNLYAAYLVAGLWSLPCLLFQKVRRKEYLFAGIFLIFTLSAAAAIFLSGCRGAYIGFAAFTCSIIVLGYKLLDHDFNITSKIKKILAAILAVLFAFGTFIVVSTPALLKRVISIFTVRGDSSSSFRMNVYHAGMEMFRDNSLLGIGVGNKVFREIYGLYMMSGFDALSAYCIYLEIGIESGIFALVSFVAFLGLLIFNCIKFINNLNLVQNKIIVLCAVSSLFAVMAHGLVDTVFFRPPVQILFWVMVAVLSVIILNGGKNEKI